MEPRRAAEEGALSRLVQTTGIDSRTLAMVAALIIIWMVLNALTGGIFLSARNLYNLTVQSCVVGIMATGMVLVITARHIDLSVGSVLGFTGMIIAYLQVELFTLGAAWNWPLSIVLGLSLGALIGLWQGYWIAYRAVPAFVVTLAGLLMFRGAAFLVTDGRTVAPMDPTYQLLGGGIDGSIGANASWILGAVAVAMVILISLSARAKRRSFGFSVKPMWAEIGLIVIYSVLILGFVMVMNSYYKPRTEIPRGIPVPALILIVVVLVMTLLSRITKFGRYVFAMGGNPEAAELSGIDVKKVTVMIFVVMGVLSAIAAVITTARLNAGANSMGMLSELSVIAAVGTIAGAILGAVIMQSLENGMVLLSVSSAARQILIGLVLIAAVWFDATFNRRKG